MDSLRDVFSSLICNFLQAVWHTVLTTKTRAGGVAFIDDDKIITRGTLR